MGDLAVQPMQRLPMNEHQFWALIEEAWQTVGGLSRERQELAQGKLPDERAESLHEALLDVVPALRDNLDRLPADDLLAFDRILERKLYDIDRSEIQEHTDGSND